MYLRCKKVRAAGAAPGHPARVRKALAAAIAVILAGLVPLIVAATPAPEQESREELPPVLSTADAAGLQVATVNLPGGGSVRSASINPFELRVVVERATDPESGRPEISVGVSTSASITPESRLATAAYLKRTTERALVRDHLNANGIPAAQVNRLALAHSDTARADGTRSSGQARTPVNSPKSSNQPEGTSSDPSGLGCNGRLYAFSDSYVIDLASGWQYSGEVTCYDGGGGGHNFYVEKINTQFYGKGHKPKYSQSYMFHGDRGGINYPDWSPGPDKNTDGEACLTFNLGLNPTPYAGLTYSTQEHICDGDQRPRTNGYTYFGTEWVVNKKWAGTALCSHPGQNYNYRSLALFHVWPNTSYYPAGLHGNLTIDL